MNPIDLEIYWNRLIAIADEAGATLKRTSFSTVVRESNDFACVLLDTEARLVAQSTLSIPGFIGTAPLTLQGMLRVFPRETLKPGDIYQRSLDRYRPPARCQHGSADICRRQAGGLCLDGGASV